MQKCWSADNGSSSANQTCIFTCCAQTYCSAGANAYFNMLTACACVPSVCQSSCNTPGDYCGGGVPNVTTSSCNSCLTAAFNIGGPCDTSPGSAIDTQCKANAGCVAYNQCGSGCP